MSSKIHCTRQHAHRSIPPNTVSRSKLEGRWGLSGFVLSALRNKALLKMQTQTCRKRWTWTQQQTISLKGHYQSVLFTESRPYHAPGIEKRACTWRKDEVPCFALKPKYLTQTFCGFCAKTNWRFYFGSAVFLWLTCSVIYSVIGVLECQVRWVNGKCLQSKNTVIWRHKVCRPSLPSRSQNVVINTRGTVLERPTGTNPEKTRSLQSHRAETNPF